MAGSGCALKVSVVTGGGFAGLVRTVSADTDALPGADAERLRTAVGRLPKEVAPAARSFPDAQQYKVTIDDDGRTTTLSFTDADIPDEARALISLLQSTT